METTNFNKFLSLQLKVQKLREGIEVQMLSPVEINAMLYLNYDLSSFIIKPTGAYPAFDAIVIPIVSILEMKTSEPTTSSSSFPSVHLRVTLPPFGVSLSFPCDFRAFSYFIDTIQFLRVTLMPNQMTPSQKEIYELKKTNEELSDTLEAIKVTKIQQDHVIQELTRLLGSLSK